MVQKSTQLVASLVILERVKTGVVAVPVLEAVQVGRVHGIPLGPDVRVLPHGAVTCKLATSQRGLMISVCEFRLVKT